MSFHIAGKDVGPVGFGMISLMNPSNKISVEEGIEVLKSALSAGANFWNAGDHYGSPQYNSLHLLNAYFTKYPEDASKVVISVKGAMDMKTAEALVTTEGINEAIDNCLRILDGKCHIDVFQPSRLSPATPVEETISAIAAYVEQGKIGSVGLSECSATSIRRAAAISKISAVEVELSLFETSILSNGVAEACKQYDIPIIAYSPMSRGFLTGDLQKHDDLNPSDFRRMLPRFQPENFDQNVKLVHEIEKVAKQKDCSPSQIALAWVKAQSQVAGVPVIPIPGTKSSKRVEENAANVVLSKQELEEINKILDKVEIKGLRVPEKYAKLLNV